MKPILAVAIAAAALAATPVVAENAVKEQRFALERALASVNEDAGPARIVTQNRADSAPAILPRIALDRIGEGVAGERFGARSNWAGNYAAGRRSAPAGR